MDKVRKALTWVWYNKERMVLAVMVAVLCYRVYQVLYPEQADEGTITFSVSNTVKPGDGPPEPGARPPRDIYFDYRSIHIQNPFWYYAASGDAQGSDGPRDIGIDLLGIRDAGQGRLLAQLRTPSITSWYDEGEQFEEYELISIDINENTVDVYSAQLNQTVTLSLEE